MFIVEKSENWNICVEATKNSHKGEKNQKTLSTEKDLSFIYANFPAYAGIP